MKRALVGAEKRNPPDKRGGAAGLAILAVSGAAQAITLGDAQVRSYLGHPLEARIPVSAAAGEPMRGACFSLAPRTATGAPALTDAELVLRRSAHGNYLEVRSHKPIEGSDVHIAIAVACPGATPGTAHDVTLQLDPPLSARLPDAAPASSMHLGSREGDTLESIAKAIVPDDAGARADYLAALRAANPALASRGADGLIAPGERIALPDLRTYARSPHAAAASRARAAAARPGTATQAAAEPVRGADASTHAPSTRAAAPARKVRAAPQPAQALARAAASPFQLKLSAPEIDLTASRNIGERERAQLRERLAMLDADDQVAAMLSLRHNLKQLEARVAELQLKLATMSPALEERAARDAKAAPGPKPVAPASATPVAAAPTTPVAAAPATPVVAAAPTTRVAPAPTAPIAAVPAAPSAPVAAPAIPPPASSPATPAPAPKPATADASRSTPAPSVMPPAETSPISKPRAARPHLEVASSEGPRESWWLWAAGALVLVLLLALVLRWRRTRDAEDWLDEPEPELQPVDEIAPESAPAEEAGVAHARVAESDADLPTRLPTNDAGELRRRYIEERFPELATGMVNLEDAGSVVKAARLMYEDGAAARAVELLQFALETHPGELRYWLALFEIYRLERLAGEFATLARRFQQSFGETEQWQKVRYFGREIDPANSLYQEPLDTLQTIGPRESRRLAAASNFDPIAENWLNAPMDFENEVLANELRNALMQKAAVTEQDLLADPMPALRHVEMFTVA